jgi:hypothetical protein
VQSVYGVRSWRWLPHCAREVLDGASRSARRGFLLSARRAAAVFESNFAGTSARDGVGAGFPGHGSGGSDRERYSADGECHSSPIVDTNPQLEHMAGSLWAITFVCIS